MTRLLLTFPEESVAEQVAYALIRFRDGRNELLNLLRNCADPRVRRTAALALGRTTQPDVAAALSAALDDEDPRVREAVTQSLERFRARHGFR